MRNRIPTRTILLSIELTGLEQAQISQNSIERVMNNAINVGSQSNTEDGSILTDDCVELKALTTKIWDRVRNAIFLEWQREVTAPLYDK